MAQETIYTRIKQRFDTLEEWQKVWETLIPKAGEICVFQIPKDTSVDGLIQSSSVRHISKTGDGLTTLKNLPWDSGISLSSIDIETSDDDVVNITSTSGSNSAAISISHAAKGPTYAYTSGNTTTSITGAGTSEVINIPQLTVDTYGHVNSVEDKSITIALPSLNVDDDSSVDVEDLSFGESITLVSDVEKASNDTISLQKTTITLPSNPVVTVTNETNGTTLTPDHNSSISVVTGVQKGDGAREVVVTTSKVTLPQETTLSKNTSDETATAATLTPNSSRKTSFTVMSDTQVNGHQITDVNKTYTLDLSNFATLSDISSAMVFKGTLGTRGTRTTLPSPTSDTVGDCYKVITEAIYNSVACTIGDLWVCNDTLEWIHIPSGDDEYKGTVTEVEAGQGLSTETNPITTSGTISHVDVTRTNSTSNASPAHGETFTAIDSVTTDTMGHISAVNTKTVTLPAQYSHPTYTARTGVPTANEVLTHGGTFTVTQPVSDGTGHITAMNTRTYTLPAHTDEKVGGVSTTTAAEYPLLFKNTTGTTTTAAKARFNSYITVNPSTKTITAATFAGNASTATKFNSARTVALTGDVTGSASNDGSGGWSVATTITDITEAEINALFV